MSEDRPPSPWGDPPADPHGGQGADPYGGQRADPYGGQGADLHGGRQATPLPGPGWDPADRPGSAAWVEARYGPVASFGDRVVALLLDSLVSLAVAVPLLVGFGISVTAFARGFAERPDGNLEWTGGTGGLFTAGVVVTVVGWLLGLAFNLWNRVFRMGRRGQSLGKSWTGLHLVDSHTGRPIGAGACLGRELLGGVVNQVFFLSYLWMLWDEDRETLADKAVHSTVVKLPKG